MFTALVIACIVNSNRACRRQIEARLPQQPGRILNWLRPKKPALQLPVF